MCLHVRKSEAITGLWLISSLCGCSEKAQKGKEMERVKEEREKQITVTERDPSAEFIFPITVTGLPPSEAINPAHYSYSRGLPSN